MFSRLKNLSTCVRVKTRFVLARSIYNYRENNIIKSEQKVSIPQDEDLFTFFSKKIIEDDAIAMVDCISGNRFTRKQLMVKSRQLASYFDKKGYKQADCVGIHVPNCIEYPVALFGTMAMGMTMTTANPAYTSHELNMQLKSANVKVLFTNSNLLDTARKAVENTNAELLISVDETNVNDSGIVNLSDIYPHADSDFVKNLSIDPHNEIVFLPYSSGTTGLPKGVMLTHQNLISNLLQLTHQFDWNITENALCILPMYHCYGLAVILLYHLYNGATVGTLPSFEPETFLSAIQDYKMQKVLLVPPLVLFLLNHPLVENYDISSIRSMTVGAAPLDKNVTTTVNEKFPDILVQQGYGMTEAGPVTHMQPNETELQKHGSTGVLLPNTECKIHCLETGEALGANQKGEVCVKGPQVMKGYLNNPDATAACLTDDGWLHTGDLGYYDDDLDFFIVDRIKELIKYKGLQVAPAEVEDVLLSHGDIIDSCVIGIPDEIAGELPRAYVVKIKDSLLTEEDVKTFIRERLSAHKQLRGGVEFVDALPKSATGKLLRRVLKDEYLAAQN